MFALTSGPAQHSVDPPSVAQDKGGGAHKWTGLQTDHWGIFFSIVYCVAFLRFETLQRSLYIDAITYSRCALPDVFSYLCNICHAKELGESIWHVFFHQQNVLVLKVNRIIISGVSTVLQ